MDSEVPVMMMTAVVMVIQPNVAVAAVGAAHHPDVAAVPCIGTGGETGEQHGCTDENGENLHGLGVIRSQFQN